MFLLADIIDPTWRIFKHIRTSLHYFLLLNFCQLARRLVWMTKMKIICWFFSILDYIHRALFLIKLMLDLQISCIFIIHWNVSHWIAIFIAWKLTHHTQYSLHELVFPTLFSGSMINHLLPLISFIFLPFLNGGWAFNRFLFRFNFMPTLALA